MLETMISESWKAYDIDEVKCLRPWNKKTPQMTKICKPIFHDLQSFSNRQFFERNISCIKAAKL